MLAHGAKTKRRWFVFHSLTKCYALVSFIMSHSNTQSIIGWSTQCASTALINGTASAISGDYNHAIALAEQNPHTWQACISAPLAPGTLGDAVTLCDKIGRLWQASVSPWACCSTLRATAVSTSQLALLASSRGLPSSLASPAASRTRSWRR